MLDLAEGSGVVEWYRYAEVVESNECLNKCSNECSNEFLGGTGVVGCRTGMRMVGGWTCMSMMMWWNEMAVVGWNS